MTDRTNELFSAATGYIARMASMNEAQRDAIGQAVALVVDTIEAKGGVVLLACQWRPDHVQIGTHTWGLQSPELTAALMEHAVNNIMNSAPDSAAQLQ